MSIPYEIDEPLRELVELIVNASLGFLELLKDEA